MHFRVYDSLADLQVNFVDKLNSIVRSDIQVIQYFSGLIFSDGKQSCHNRDSPLFYINIVGQLPNKK